MSDKITYRELVPDDYDSMIAAWNAAGLPAKPVGRDSRAELSQHLLQEPEFFIGAFDNDKLIGLVIASSDRRKGWINRLAVIPDYRGRGIARELIRRAEQALYKTGIRIISCLIFKTNLPSIKLFESEDYDSTCPVLYLRKAFSDDV